MPTSSTPCSPSAAEESFSLLSAPFVDFGPLGAAAYLLAYGALMRLLWHRATQGPGDAAIYGQAATAILLSVHSNFVASQDFVFSVLVILAITRLPSGQGNPVLHPMSRLDSLQWLRALAAMMVLVGHVIEEAAHYRDIAILRPPCPGHAGSTSSSSSPVSLSPCPWRISQDHPRVRASSCSAASFRVVPLYWIFTTLMVAALLVAPSGVKDTDLDPAQILSSYFFWPYERHDGRIAPVLSLGWTLNYEMFFYLLAGTALVLRWPLTVAGLLAMLTILVLFGAILDPTQVALTFWTNSIVLEFGFGVLLALVWRRRGTQHLPLLAILLAGIGLAALVMLHGTSLPRAVAAGIPAALIVAGPVLFLVPPAGPLNRMGLALGDASYALYLSHRFVLRLATLALLPFLPARNGRGSRLRPSRHSRRDSPVACRFPPRRNARSSRRSTVG